MNLGPQLLTDRHGLQVGFGNLDGLPNRNCRLSSGGKAGVNQDAFALGQSQELTGLKQLAGAFLVSNGDAGFAASPIAGLLLVADFLVSQEVGKHPSRFVFLGVEDGLGGTGSQDGASQFPAIGFLQLHQVLKAEDDG